MCSIQLYTSHMQLVGLLCHTQSHSWSQHMQSSMIHTCIRSHHTHAAVSWSRHIHEVAHVTYMQSAMSHTWSLPCITHRHTDGVSHHHTMLWIISHIWSWPCHTHAIGYVGATECLSSRSTLRQSKNIVQFISNYI